MSTIPQLETQRLIMRGFCAADFETYAGFMADEDVMRYLSGSAMTRAEAWRALAANIGHWELRGYGTWAVVRKEDGALVGRVGMINPEGWPGLEIGWTLGKTYWGKGYATEAAAAAMRYAFLTQPVDRLISCIDPDNKASQAVAARLGETKGERSEVVMSGRTYVFDIWSISRVEWSRRQAAN